MHANSAVLGAIAVARALRDAKRPLSAVKRIADRRLKRTLTLAYRDVPYYRDVMDAASYRPERDYRGPQDLLRLPVLTKAVLKERGQDAFVPRGVDLARHFSETTAGSTGAPLTVWRGPCARACQLAKYMRALLLNGYRPHHKVLGFRQTAKRVSQDESFLQRLGLVKWRKVDYTLQPEILVDEFLAFQPDILYGNRIHFDLLYQELEKRGGHYGRLKLGLPGGEVVLKTHTERYREVLGCDVAITYGSTELGTIAFQVVGSDGLRLCEDLLHYEFLDADGNPAQRGQRSRIVVTDLTNPLMPLIRYEQGDWVVLAKRDEKDLDSWNRLESVEGRQNETCVLPDGSRFVWLVPYDVMCNYPKVRQFRFIQKTRTLFVVQLAGDADYVESIRDSVIADLRRMSPASAEFEIVRVDQIKPDPTGKLRTLVCEVHE